MVSDDDVPPTVVDEYAEWLASWASATTVRARKFVASALLRAVGGVDGLDADSIQRWLGRDLEKWSRATYYAHLNDFCGWLVATGRMAENPMPDVRKPRRPRSLPRPLSDVEVEQILATAKGREKAWVLLALLAGLRAHEIAKVRGEDVTAESIYVEGKGDVRALLPTHPDLWQLAHEYPRRGYWFPSRDSGRPISAETVSTRVGKLFREAGISGSVHRCRHTYGTRLLRAGVNVRQVQALMRHANLETTATYTAIDEDQLRGAINRLSA